MERVDKFNVKELKKGDVVFIYTNNTKKMSESLQSLWDSGQIRKGVFLFVIDEKTCTRVELLGELPKDELRKIKKRVEELCQE